MWWCVREVTLTCVGKAIIVAMRTRASRKSSNLKWRRRLSALSLVPFTERMRDHRKMCLSVMAEVSLDAITSTLYTFLMGGTE